MVVENIAYEIGDILLIQNKFPTFGNTSVTGYTDSIIGTTSQRFFYKEFSYSVDGIFFVDWQELNTNNLNTIQVTSTKPLYINYRYTRSGTDSSGTLTFNSVSLNTVYSTPTPTFSYYYLPNSIFRDLYLYNPEHTQLSSIYTKKLYDKGVIPEYIVRGETSNPAVDDEDYLSFWKTVSDFFTIILLYYKKNIVGFEEVRTSMTKYMYQRGLYFDSKSQLQDLNYAKQNFYKEIAKRGTEFVFKVKGSLNEIDGEFLRLIGYEEQKDEFHYDLYYNEKASWCLGKTSPSYKGNTMSLNTIKTPNKDGNVEISTGKYNICANSGTVVEQTESGKKIVKISNVSSGDTSGFNIDNTIFSDEILKAILVDPRIDYEISFWVKQNLLVETLTFGCLGYDSSNNEVLLKESTSNLDKTVFFERKKMNIEDQYYFVRGIIYNKSKIIISNDDAKLNIGFGKQLRFADEVCKIIPIIICDKTVDSSTGDEIFIKGLVVRPLVNGLSANTVYSDNSETPSTSNTPIRGSFSKCFLTTNNILNITCCEKNEEMTSEQIEDYTRQKLIPYNSILKITKIQ